MKHKRTSQEPRMATDKQNDKYVTELRVSDVLFGRGSGPNDHEGNIQFRSYVAERKDEYMATNHRMTKAKIAKEIVDKVFTANGRFLKKVEPTELKSLGMPEGSDVWEVVGDETIMEKAKQALRQNTQKAKSSASDDADANKAKQHSPQPNKPLERSASEGRHRHSHVPPITTSSRMDPSVVNLGGEFEPLPISPASYGSGEPPGFSPLASQATRMAAAPGTNFAPWGNHASGMNNRVGHVSQMGPAGHLHYQQHPHMHEMMMHSRQHQQARDDSMLSYVRRNHLYQPQHLHAHNEITPQPSLDASNLSMAQIPHDDMVGPAPVRLSEVGRQGSMNMADLTKSSQGGGQQQQQQQQHLPVMEMHELMDSFSKMKTGGGATGDETKKMHASIETMGTIEHINPGSIADMSLGTMGSSTFSLFRGNESLAAMDDKLLDHQNQPPTPENIREGGFNDPGSMSLSDVWGPRRKSSGTTTSGVTMSGSLVSQNNSSSTTSKESAPDNRSLRDSLAYQPKPIKLTESDVSGLDVEQMGSSSLSVLKAAYTINEEENRHVPQKTFYVGDHAPSKEK